MPQRYLSFLLRLWKVEDPDHPGWRASLEDPHTRQVTSFSSLATLYEYLLQLTGSTSSPGEPSMSLDKAE